LLALVLILPFYLTLTLEMLHRNGWSQMVELAMTVAILPCLMQETLA
jgi:hypothetical protein